MSDFISKALDAIRATVTIEQLLTDAGFSLRVRGNTPEAKDRAVRENVWKNAAGLAIKINPGGRWGALMGNSQLTSPLNNGAHGGDVLALYAALVEHGHLQGYPPIDRQKPLMSVIEGLGPKAGIRRGKPIVVPPKASEPAPAAAERAEERLSTAQLEELWNKKRQMAPGCRAWRYLVERRGIDERVLARAGGELREGPYGRVLMAHRDAEGRLTGWEYRHPNPGPDELAKGFQSKATKTLFGVGSPAAEDVVVTEAGIDALSVGTLHICRKKIPEDAGIRLPPATTGLRVVSLGGGFGAATQEALRAACAGKRVWLATDNDQGGRVLARDIRAALEGVPVLGIEDFQPPYEGADWNEVLLALKNGSYWELREAQQASPNP